MDTINLLHIEFETGSDSLLPQSLIEIDRAKRFLENYPQIRIEIDGHTDNQGGHAYNMNLSQLRAEAVKRALVNSGIKEYRMEAQGFGYTKPIAPNNTPEGRQRNHRTEFIILN